MLDEQLFEAVGYEEIIRFLLKSKYAYAICVKPIICKRLIKRFWRTAQVDTNDEGVKVDGNQDDIQDGNQDDILDANEADNQTDKSDENHNHDDDGDNQGDDSNDEAVEEQILDVDENVITDDEDVFNIAREVVMAEAEYEAQSIDEADAHIDEFDAHMDESILSSIAASPVINSPIAHDIKQHMESSYVVVTVISSPKSMDRGEGPRNVAKEDETIEIYQI
ncbi:hypothetical protein QVD17_12325 [Tagetes erecta]|uniref:Uncharacterized protein n=1 Tax=Tagetes erecta TaxID=13708 RepID=A0AAD8L244_TARER|nr:hypothetical protein QVD17_12325 [Tagetes erecta]